MVLQGMCLEYTDEDGKIVTNAAYSCKPVVIIYRQLCGKVVLQ